MYLLGEFVKSSNLSRVIVLLIVAIIWRIFLGNNIEIALREPYITPVLGFLVIAVVIGELSRRLFRFFFKKRDNRQTKLMSPENRVRFFKQKDETETLNIAILLSVLLTLATYIYA